MLSCFSDLFFRCRQNCIDCIERDEESQSILSSRVSNSRSESAKNNETSELITIKENTNYDIKEPFPEKKTETLSVRSENPQNNSIDKDIKERFSEKKTEISEKKILKTLDLIKDEILNTFKTSANPNQEKKNNDLDNSTQENKVEINDAVYQETLEIIKKIKPEQKKEALKQICEKCQSLQIKFQFCK